MPYNPIMAHSFLLIFCLFSSFILFTNIHACNQIEHSSLLSFSQTLSSPPSNWTSANCCHWKGITCNPDGFVTHLLLPSKGLQGGIFPSLSFLANLTHLKYLNLSHNSLSGSLPNNKLFSSLVRCLEILDLSYNLISGELPLSPLSSNIQILDLSSNLFHGAIPSSFFQQSSNLTSFNVSNNNFSGSIPSSSICLQHSSPFIKLLDFSFNIYNGSILRGLGECSKLQVFRAGNNNLSGQLPNDIYNATKLEEISLPSNSLHGAISDRIANLTNLVILDLSHNQLSGELPIYFGRLSKLKLMHLEFNNLNGHLPQSLMNCTRLMEVHLTNNMLEGEISTLNFSKLSHLTKLDLGYNNFIGKLPTSIYSCKSLKAIRLTKNQLEGEIQPEILSLKSLSFLALGDNRLTNPTGAMKVLMRCKSLLALLLPNCFKGEEIFPADDDIVDFDGLQNLKILSLYRCGLTGQIPEWLAKLKNLQVLHLDGNRMTGSIPIWLGALPKLSFVSLANNSLSGELPKQLCGLPSIVNASHQLVDYYDLEFPILVGPFKGKYYPFHQLAYFPKLINLAYNNITGNIPTEIGRLQLLQILLLSNNNFSGNIPEQIFSLKLEVLDLSSNQFSGNIPWSVTSLNFLRYFNVSYNNLEGEIPTGTQLQSFNASAFEGNPKLCGLPLLNNCQSSTSDVDDNNNNHFELPWFYISVAVGFIVGFWGVCGSLVICKTWRYTYFRFAENVQDWLYDMITVRINMIKRRINRG